MKQNPKQDSKTSQLGKAKESLENIQHIKEDRSTSFVNSNKQRGDSLSAESKLPGNPQENILDQQILLGKSSDSNEEEENALKFLPLLNEPSQSKKRGSKILLEGSPKTSKKNKFFYEEGEENKANKDTFNFLRQLTHQSKKMEERETVLKAKEENKNLFKRGGALSKERNLEAIEIEEDIREEKKGSLELFGQGKSAIADVLLKRANMGTRGLGYIGDCPPSVGDSFQKEKIEMDSIHNYDVCLEQEQKTRRKAPSESGYLMEMLPKEEYPKRRFKHEQELQMLMGKRDSMQNIHEAIQFCQVHSYKKIEFICSSEDCLKELCSMCILEHKEHIDMIKHVHTHIKEQYEIVKDMNLKKIKTKINEEEEKNSEKLDAIYGEIKDILYQRIHGLKDNLVKSNNKVRTALNNMKRFKQQFSILDQNPRMLEFSTFFSKRSSELIKSCISFPTIYTNNTVQIEQNILKQKLGEALRDNMAMICPNTDFNSVNADISKFLHWFEWGGRNLHLYDIVNNKSRSIRLVNNIKIPTFSRSIMIPEGKIFLLGGEDPEGQPKREIYQFDLANLDSDHILEAKALMPHQKYDFTLCFLDGYIYVICGKDTSSEAVDICER